MTSVNCGEQIYLVDGRQYGPGSVEIDDSTKEGDLIASRLEKDIERVKRIAQKREEERAVRANRFLTLRAAAGDQEAINLLRQKESSEGGSEGGEGSGKLPGAPPAAPPQNTGAAGGSAGGAGGDNGDDSGE